jgi:hypothetical protein
MANRRTTFGKLQRERDKKAKALEKADRRAARLEGQGQQEEPVAKAADQDAVLAALAELHQRFDAGTVSIDEFELRRDELTSRLRVD